MLNIQRGSTIQHWWASIFILFWSVVLPAALVLRLVAILGQPNGDHSSQWSHFYLCSKLESTSTCSHSARPDSLAMYYFPLFSNIFTLVLRKPLFLFRVVFETDFQLDYYINQPKSSSAWFSVHLFPPYASLLLSQVHLFNERMTSPSILLQLPSSEYFKMLILVSMGS